MSAEEQLKKNKTNSVNRSDEEDIEESGIDKDHLMAKSQNLFLSSGAIVGIVVVSLFFTLLIIDVSCFFVNQAGLLYLMCGSKKKSAQEESKLTSEEKELLRENGRPKVELLDERLKKETKLTYDDKNSSVKTTFVGKDSAV